jgi:hypothetical protein
MNNDLKGKKGEEFVNEIANKNFLDYWCFPNPYDEKGNKKEICDLLILFKNFCIICQIKNYEFKGNYDRYFKKAIDNGVKQIQGAERKLFSSNRNIYFKNEKQGLIKFEKEKYSQIIRIVIHLGENVDYHSVGQISKSNSEFIHIIGKEGIKTLLNDITTISDFVDYLEARESLVTKIEKVALVGNERDLLGFYLQIKPQFTDFINDNKDKKLLINLESGWADYEKSKKLDENEDILLEIENFIYDWVDLVLIKTNKGQIISEYLMSLNREERRLFAVSFFGFKKTYTNNGYKQIVRRNILLNNIGFVFFYYPESYENESIKELMTLAAEGYALFLDFEVSDFVIYAISDSKKSYSIQHVNIQKGDEEQLTELKMLLDYAGWFKEDNLKYYSMNLKNGLTSKQ